MQEIVLKKKRSLDLMTVLAFLMVARFSCAALSNIPFFSMAFIFIYGAAFFVLFLLSKKRIKARELLLLASALLYAAYTFCQALLAGKSLFFTEPFNAYMIVFMVLVYLWSKEQPASVSNALMAVIFVGLLFSYCYSLYVLHLDPSASRMAATGEKSPHDVLNAAGGFAAVYGGVNLICIFLFSLRVMKNSKGIKKNAVIVLLILALLFLAQASYATALLLTVLIVALFFSSNNRVLSGVLVVATVLVLILHDPVGQWVMQISDDLSLPRILQDKLYDFGEMLKTFEAAGTYAGEGGRMERIQRSIDTFLKYPILGGYAAKDGRFGNHCELFDTLGKFGIVGFSLLVTFFVTLYRDVIGNLQSREMRRCCKTIFLIYAITSAMNPSLFSGQILPLALVMPLMAVYADSDSAQKIIENKEG